IHSPQEPRNQFPRAKTYRWAAACGFAPDAKPQAAGSGALSSLAVGSWSFLLTFGALAQRAQVFQGEDAGIVAIAPGDLVGVAADRRHGDGSQRLQLFRLEDSEGVGRLLALFATAGAGTVTTQVFPGVDATVAVAPLDDELVG